MNSTAVIIVNYNKRQLLLDCLLSLEKAVHSNGQVIVVDNGSTDGSVEMVKEKFKEMQIIEMGYNSGFCKANNIGMKKALEIGFENVILLNNDTQVDEQFVDAMEQTVDKKRKVGMIAAQIVLLKEPNVIDSTGISITPDGLGKNRGHGEGKKKHQEKNEVFCPAGAAALYTKELLYDVQQNGQFLDEEYEFYLEEVDLGWRARLRGWRCIYEPKAVVLHLKRASTDQFASKMMYLANRNIYLNIIKNYPSFYFVIKALKLSVLRNLFLIWGMIFGRGVVSQRKEQVGIWEMIKLYFKGINYVFSNIKGLLSKRNNIQNRRTISKSESRNIFQKHGLGFFESIYKL